MRLLQVIPVDRQAVNMQALVEPKPTGRTDVSRRAGHPSVTMSRELSGKALEPRKREVWLLLLEPTVQDDASYAPLTDDERDRCSELVHVTLQSIQLEVCTSLANAQAVTPGIPILPFASMPAALLPDLISLQHAVCVFYMLPLCLHVQPSLCRRQAAVKAAAQHSWQAYVTYAWGMDELMPLTQRGKNSFGGLGCTIVDSLDTLWLMGMKESFAEARNWVAEALQFDR